MCVRSVRVAQVQGGLVDPAGPGWIRRVGEQTRPGQYQRTTAGGHERDTEGDDEEPDDGDQRQGPTPPSEQD